MRTFLYTLLTVFLLCVFMACSKDKENGDALFITGTEVNPSTTLTVDAGASSTAISVTSSGLVNTDIAIKLKIDTTLIASFNRANNKAYVAPPAGIYSLSGDEVTIKSGEYVSNAVNFTISSNSQLRDGIAYMVPVTISSSGSNLPVLPASRTVYIVINKVIRSTVASIAGNYFTCDFSQNNDNLKAMTNLTYEARVLVSGFQNSSPFISSLMGIEENYLLRFGDVTIGKDQLQQAGGSALTVAAPFATGKWYHVALTYDGSTQKIFVDGALAASRSLTRTVDLTQGGFYIGRSAGGRLLNGLVSECRVWSKALTQTEIINGMCGVDPSTPGLVAYWKLNEGTGRVASDLSGNHHDATASGNVTWVPNVRCN